MEFNELKTTTIVMFFWFTSVVLGVITFVATRAMVIRTYIRFFPGEPQAALEGKGTLSFLNILISFPLTILMIVIIIGGFEFYRRKENHQQAWRFLTITLAIETAVLTLAFFI